MVNDTASVVAKSSAPIFDASGLMPNFSLAAASAPRTSRSGRVERIGPGAPRPRPPPVAGGGPGATTGAPRVIMRGLRQITTGATPGAGLRLANVRWTGTGPEVGGAGAPRPRAPRSASGYV